MTTTQLIADGFPGSIAEAIQSEVQGATDAYGPLIGEQATPPILNALRPKVTSLDVAPRTDLPIELNLDAENSSLLDFEHAVPPFVWAYTTEPHVSAPQIVLSVQALVNMAKYPASLTCMMQTLDKVVRTRINDTVSSSFEGGRTLRRRLSGRFDQAGFFKALNTLLDAGRKSKALNYVFTSLDRLLLDVRFADVDQVIRAVHVRRYDYVVLVGFLTVTLPWKEDVPARAELFARARKRAEAELSASRVREMFSGLD